MPTFTYLLAGLAVVAVLYGRAECRPQPQDAERVDGDGQAIQPQQTFFIGGEYGTVAGEIVASSGDVFVAKRPKKKKKQRSGPSVSALVASPPVASVGLSAGLTFVPSEAKVEIIESP